MTMELLQMGGGEFEEAKTRALAWYNETLK